MRRKIGLGLGLGLGLVLIVLVLVAAQIFLPGIAASRIRQELSHHGRVESVQVSAFPAIELLWHRAGSVAVHMTHYRASSRQLVTSLHQVVEAGTVRATVNTVDVGLLSIHDARFEKNGDHLSGQGVISQSDLTAAADGLVQGVTPVESSSGHLVFEFSVPLIGQVDATVTASAGRIQATPDLPIVGRDFTFTLFSDPEIRFGSIRAAKRTGGFSVSVSGALA